MLDRFEQTDRDNESRGRCMNLPKDHSRYLINQLDVPDNNGKYIGLNNQMESNLQKNFNFRIHTLCTNYHPRTMKSNKMTSKFRSLKLNGNAQDTNNPTTTFIRSRG